jgi:hypothetical protein
MEVADDRKDTIGNGKDHTPDNQDTEGYFCIHGMKNAPSDNEAFLKHADLTILIA